MSLDDDADDEVPGIVPPLPPDDRLWRHPSELSTWGAGAGPARSEPPSLRSRSAPWASALLAGALGAVVCGVALVAVGGLTPVRSERVVEKVSVTPVVSSPMLVTGTSGEALAGLVGPAVVRLVVTTDSATRLGSGVLVRDDGLVVTSAHLIAEATAVEVALADGRRVEGRVLGVDRPTDVAVIAIDADRLTVAVLGTSSTLKVGATVMAMGASTDGSGLPSVATGVVSALDRRLDLAGGPSLHGMIQTDAPTEPSWTGGPLVDASGAVIGIIADPAAADAGFGFATPIDIVHWVGEQVAESGSVRHAWLGIEGTDLSDGAARVQGLDPSGGVIVQAVVADSPAARAGLRPDDVITEIGDDSVRSSSALVVAMRRHLPGELVPVGYWRAGRHHEAAVIVGARPASAG